MRSSLISSLVDRLRNARFFSVSLAIHLLLGIGLGGVVLFKATQPQTAFIVSDAGSFLAQTDEAPAPTSEENLEFEEPPSPSAEPATAISEASAIQSLSNTASFEMNMASPVQTMGSTLSGNLSQPLTSGKGGGGGTGTGAARPMGSFFGVANTQAEGLIGTFYDLKQTQNRKPTDMDRQVYLEVVEAFIRSWNPSKLGKYFQAPNKLVTSQIFTPNIDAKLAPAAFAVEKDVQPSLWVAWYRARISPPKTGTYHFVGAGDDVLFVRVNGKMVLDRSWYLRLKDRDSTVVANYDYGFSRIKDGFAKGLAFKAEKGQFYDIDILIGEQPGGLFYASLLIEEEGETYEKDPKGNPILPIFRVANELPSTEGNPVYPPYAKNGPIWQVQAPK